MNKSAMQTSADEGFPC